jgi:hypothetical protein
VFPAQEKSCAAARLSHLRYEVNHADVVTPAESSANTRCNNVAPLGTSFSPPIRELDVNVV